MAENTLTPQEANDGWQLLFDGSSLSGWSSPFDDHGWVVDDGCIACLNPVGRKRNLYSDAQYEDFIIKLEYRIDPEVNSGLFLRTSDLEDPVNTSLEIQILDSFGATELTTHTCAAIYDLVPPSEAVFKPAGEWNSVTVTCQGSKAEVEHNGVAVAQIDVDLYTEPGKNPDGSSNKFQYALATLPRRGHIGLQDHKGRIWFRNIKVKEL